MPRRAAPSTHVIASLRAWFGLDQTTLALYLGVSADLIHAVERGQRRLGPAAQAALLPLLRQLPPPEIRAAAEATSRAEAAGASPGAAAPLLPGPAEAPDAAELAFRRRQCRHRAARCLAQASALAQQARVAARWQAALPALLAAAADSDDPIRTAAHAAWLAGWLRNRALPLPAAAATRYHRLRAQAAGLLAEAAALV